ncbi:hypothetical protein LOTGIDRAFT_176744, partial [Lottia gigantea]
LETEGKLPLETLEPLLGLVNSVNLHPVKVSMYLRDNMILVNESYKVSMYLHNNMILVNESYKVSMYLRDNMILVNESYKVSMYLHNNMILVNESYKVSMYLHNNMILVNESYKVSMYLRDNMILVNESYKKNMKARDTNDVMAVKLHYFTTIIRLARKSHDDKNDNLQFWIKSLVKGRDQDGFPEFAERVVRQSLKEFPYVDSQLFQTLVRQISSVKIGDTPTALSSLIAGVNGNQFAMAEDVCATCGERNAVKSCSVCKYTQLYGTTITG